MTHELTITFDDKLLARKYCISCSCGWKGSAETYAEGEQIVVSHQNWESQKERLKERGMLK